MVISLPTAARSAVATTCTASCGSPAAARAWTRGPARCSSAAPRCRRAGWRRCRTSGTARPRRWSRWGAIRDDADHAQRHAHLRDAHAVGAQRSGGDAADGSGRAAIWRRPSAISPSVLSDRARRSSSAGSRPLAGRSQVFSLAALSSSRLAASASAMACSARFLAAPLARIARGARHFARVSMACSMVDEDMAASIMK